MCYLLDLVVSCFILVSHLDDCLKAYVLNVLFHRYETVRPCQQTESGGRGAETYGKREAQSGGITSTSSTSVLVDTHAFYKSSSF